MHIFILYLTEEYNKKLEFPRYYFYASVDITQRHGAIQLNEAHFCAWDMYKQKNNLVTH